MAHLLRLDVGEARHARWQHIDLARGFPSQHILATAGQQLQALTLVVPLI